MSGRISIPLIDEARSRRTLELLSVLWILAMADLFFTIWAYFIFTPFKENSTPWRARCSARTACCC